MSLGGYSLLVLQYSSVMKSFRISNFLFAFSLLILSCYSLITPQFSKSNPTADIYTTWATTYLLMSFKADPILLRETNIAKFACGFFCERDCTSYIFATFISGTNELNWKVVWSANVDYPVRDDAILTFSAAGDLMLKDGDGSIVWTTNTAGKSVVGMNLTDTGNLVLFDDHNSVVWQSFDHPTDSLLPGQKLFQGQKLKSSVSVDNSSYQGGMYSLQVTDNGLVAYVESNPQQVYYNKLIYGNNTNKGRSYIRFLNGNLSFFIHSSEPSDPDDVIDIPKASSAQYMKLMPDGHLQVFKWQSDSWMVATDLTAVFGAYSTANLSTTWGTSYSDYQPMLLIETKRTQYACGFLREEDGTDSKSFRYIFSIFISATNSGLSRDSEVIWSANRDYPVGDNAILNFTAVGELSLQDVDGSIVWTTNTSGKSVAGMKLTETGNLVLFNDHNSVVWQSFDHPTDCLLPGQKLFTGQKLKSSVSSTNLSEGMFYLQLTHDGLFAYVESNPPQAYYNEFDNPYGNDTNNGRRYIMLWDGHLSVSLSILSSDPSNPDVNENPQASTAQYLKLMPDGHLQVFEWQNAKEYWTVVSDLIFDDNCSYPLVCGRSSICLTDQQCTCPAPEYFRPVNNRELNQGCTELTPLTCNSTQAQGFITLENVTYFTFIADMKGVSMESCKQACLNNCSCKAAFFRYLLDASSGECFLPSELFTMKTVDPLNYNALAFIKVQNVTSHRVSHQVAVVIGSTIGSFVLLLAVAIGIITYVVQKRKKDAEMEEEYLDQVPGMPTRFSYDELKTATEKFSKKLGEGGFGSVFEGTLGDGSRI